MFRPPRLVRLLPLLFALLALAPARAAVFYVNKAASGPTHDGASWASAFQTVQEGVNAAAPNGEVWVAAGSYAEPVTLAQSVQLYGGFAGGETDRSQRLPRTNEAVIDGVSVIAGPDVTSAAIFDGFSIRGSNPELNCTTCSPTIRNNVFKDNTWGSDWTTTRGGAIRCTAGANPLIANNLIIKCYAFRGGAIYVADSSPVLVNNTLYSDGPLSSTDGTYIGSGTAYIAGAGSLPVFVNNIVDGAEFSNDATAPGSATFRNNLFYAYFTASGDGAKHFRNMPDPTGTNGNIADVDPVFVNPAHRDFRLQPGSPCVDAGDDSAVIPGEPDVYGATRLQGAHVDMGAAESDGLSHTTPAWVQHVSPVGNNINDGLTWQTAKRTISGATGAISPGDEVWVQAGTYTSASGGVGSDMGLYGGFTGVETSRDQRDPRHNATILVGYANSSVLNASGSGVIDGFTIRSAKPSSGTPTDTGIRTYSFTGRISNNVIEGHAGGGILVSGPGSCTISNNRITGNASPNGGGAISVRGQSNALIANNVIYGNSASGASASTGNGGGVYADATSAPAIVNNTFVANSAAGAGGAVCATQATLANNIVAHNVSGVALGTGSTVISNCVYDNGAYDYQGIADPTGTDGNLRADPVFAGYKASDVHIQAASPCRDAGNDSYVNASDSDLDGRTRVIGAHVDIGAYESDGTDYPAAVPTVIRVSSTGSDDNDGSSWDKAKKTIQAALNAGGIGAEIRVAAGTYAESITPLLFSAIYGGYDGVSDLAPRDPVANVTTLNRSASGRATIAASALIGAVVDGFSFGSSTWISCTGSTLLLSNNTMPAGFRSISCSGGDQSTIRNNRFLANTGTDITSTQSSPVIAGNTFQDNSGTSAPISCTAGSPVICGNVITRCAGGAVSALSGTPIVKNNVIAGNKGTCAVTVGSTGLVANNTIVSNAGIGLTTTGATAENNILCYNSTYGVSAPAVALKANCIFSNKSGPYSGFSYTEGSDPNILVDPQLANVPGGDYHIQPSSPCRDAGDGSVVATGDTDMDAQPRIQGARVDIGADESDGTAYAPYALRVSPSGNDTNDGLSWEKAKATVQAAVDAVNIAGAGEVWVAAGTYGAVTLKLGVNLYGGFTGTETEASQRNSVRNITILDGNKVSNTVTIDSAASGILDGFTIQHAGSTLTTGVGVYGSSSSPIISHNTITGNLAGGIIFGAGAPAITGNTISCNTAQGFGGGIRCGQATITDNLIAFNTTQYSTLNRCSLGGGLYISSGSPIILRNVFLGNTVNAGTEHLSCAGGAICAASGSAPYIANNTFRDNYAWVGGAVFAADARILNNTFSDNLAMSGSALYLYDGSPVIANNTIVSQSSSTTVSAVGIHAGTAALVNNVIAFNSAGVEVVSPGAATLHCNDIYGNGTDFTGLSDPTGTDGNIHADPLLLSIATGDFHLREGSPCIGVGDNSVVGSGDTDMDGEARLQGPTVDMGADEFDGTTPSLITHIVRVSPSGSDYNDGSSWNQAKRTLNGALLTAAPTGGEVWVSAGEYNESLLLRSFVSWYGGFAGTEAARDDRDFRRNRSIIDAGGNGSVVSASNVRSAALDGFEIRNGNASGVFLSYSSVRVANNTISGCMGATQSSPFSGLYCKPGGIGVVGGDPVLAGNVVRENSGAGIGVSNTTARIVNNIVTWNDVGIEAYDASVIANNTITDNGIGLFINNRNTPLCAIANNITTRNAYGTLFSLYQAPMSSFRNNCVYGNTSADYSGATDQTGQNGNIKADPELAGAALGNFHIQPTSPCRDAGDDSVAAAGDADMDAQPRIQGAHADIGADESDARLWANAIPVIRVATSGDDRNDGSSWSTAKRTVQAALDAAGQTACEVWVARGEYTGCLTVWPYTRLYGGFAGVEDSRDQRNWATNPTVLDGAQAGSVVRIPAGSMNAVVDGFTIRNGRAIFGGGVYAASMNYEVAHNAITGNTAIPGKVGSGSLAVTVPGYGGGMVCAAAGAVHDNVIAHNTAASGGAVMWRQNMIGYIAVTRFVNNTVTGNSSTATTDTGAVVLGYSSATCANNIVAFNAGGGIGISGSGTVTVRNNDAFGNGTDFVNCPVGAGAQGNISLDPSFMDASQDNYRLQQASPCINTGDNTAVVAGVTDLNGWPRVDGGTVDIGAYEFYAMEPGRAADVKEALRTAGGLSAPEGAVAPTGTLDIVEAVRLARKACGLDAG